MLARHYDLNEVTKRANVTLFTPKSFVGIFLSKFLDIYLLNKVSSYVSFAACVYNTHGGESRDLNNRVHGISCRYSDKTSKQIYHTFLNTQPIFIKQSAHTS